MAEEDGGPTTEAGVALLEELAGEVPIVPGPTFRKHLIEQIKKIEEQAAFDAAEHLGKMMRDLSVWPQ